MIHCDQLGVEGIADVPRYPTGMYTCLSGFVDLCEPVEEAFKREAFEEVGNAQLLSASSAKCSSILRSPRSS